MSVQEILDRYEAAVREKERQARIERQDRINRRKMIAASLQRLLADVVRPVLAEAEGELTRRGFVAMVAVGHKTDPMLERPAEVLVSLSLETGTSRSGGRADCHLRYTGTFEEETIACSVQARPDRPPVRRKPVPFSEVSSASVSCDVEAFLAEVFRV